MAIKYIDGFDHYGTGSTGLSNMGLNSWTTWAGSFNVGPSTAQPRTGTNSLQCITNGGVGGAPNSGVQRPFTGGSVGGFGFAIKGTTSGVDSNPTNAWFGFANSADNGFGVMCQVLSTGQIAFSNGGYGGTYVTTYGTTPAAAVSSGWTYIEVFAVAGGAGACTIDLQVNGVPFYSLTGLTFGVPSFIGSGGATFDKFFISSVAANAAQAIYYDDLALWDNTGTINTTFLGDKKVSMQLLSADTSTAEWAKTGSTTGYGCVNEVPQDGDTTYLSASGSSSLPVRSTFNHQSSPADAGTIFAVQTTTLAKKTDSGTATLAVDITSGTSTTSGTANGLGLSYAYANQIFEKDPNTSAAWTKTGFDNSTITLRRVS